MSLTTKLSLLLCGLTLAVVAGSMLPLYIAERRHILAQSQQRQLADTEQFARVCANSAPTDDQAGRLDYLKTFLTVAPPGTVAFAAFLDAAGRVATHSDFLRGDLSLKGRRVSAPYALRAVESPAGLRQRAARGGIGPAGAAPNQGAGAVLEVLSSPIYLSGSQGRRRTGTALVAYNLAAVDASISRLQRDSLGRVLRSAVQGLFLGLLLALAFGRALILPIERLGAGARRIGQGALDTRLPEDRKDELGQLAREFNAMAARLAELDEMKDNFLAQITHDLRNPLAAVMSHVDILLMGLEGGLTGGQEKCLRTAADNLSYLNELIGNILDVTRLEAGRLELKPARVELGGLVRSILELMRARAEQFGVALDASEVPEDAVVHADAEALKRVLVNLVSNALQFTPQGGRVSIAWSEAGSRDRIAVSDTGIGIPPERLGALFQKFSQVRETKNKVRPTHGTGLGLVICKQLVGAHGGDIGVDSTYGTGTTFWFTLPRVVSGLEAAAQPKPRSD